MRLTTRELNFQEVLCIAKQWIILSNRLDRPKRYKSGFHLAVDGWIKLQLVVLGSFSTASQRLGTRLRVIGIVAS